MSIPGASYPPFSTQNLDVYYDFYKGIMHFPCRGQENELVVGRENQVGHNEDMKGACMEIKPSPPSNPYGIDL